MSHSVLVIEDDPDIGELLRLNIASEANDVTVESDGIRGLLPAQRRNRNLLVIDWLLPGTDGVSICRRVRATNQHVPTIMLTARSPEVDRVGGLDSGADDYIARPFSIAELLARVRAQLRRARASISNWFRATCSIQPSFGLAVMPVFESSIPRRSHA